MAILNEKTIEVKPCPFCGSAAKYYEELYDEYIEDPVCFVKCRGNNGPCYCQTPAVKRTPNFDPKEKLIEMWNRRVGEDGN